MGVLDDIAQRASLSRSSVAKVLRNAPGFTQETRARVLRAARELHYRPNFVGKALASGRTMTLGLVVNTSRSQVFVERREAMEKAAEQGGYSTVTVAHRATEPAHLLARAVQNLLDRQVDGLVVYLAQANLAEPSVQQVLRQCRLPMVFIDAALPQAPAVIQLDRGAAYAALAEHLAKLGHRQVAFVRTPTELAIPFTKVTPAVAAFEHVGMECLLDDRWVLDPTLPPHVASYTLVQAIARSGRMPTALLMTNDDGAVAAMAALQDLGLRVPDDVSIVGFDDLPHAAFVRPALTTVRQPGAELGALAFDLLLQQIQNPGQPVEPVRLSCRLVVRDTTGPAPAGKPAGGPV